MVIIFSLIILLVSFYVLIKASDYFVEAASSIAKRLGISELVIGLTLVSIGTSIPELASSIIAAYSNSSGIVLGNVIGSNIANIALIIGLSAILAPIAASRSITNKDGTIMLFVTIFLVFALEDLVISFYEGLIFVILYMLYLLFLFETSAEESKTRKDFTGFVNYVLLFGYLRSFRRLIRNKKDDIPDERVLTTQTLKDAGIIVVSLGGIFFGAKFLVEQAIGIATYFGLSEVFIGLTVIAVGTSLPELSVTVSAVKKKYSDIAIGNIIGSNIANILLVGGVASLVSPLVISFNEAIVMLTSLVLVSGLFILFLRAKGLKRLEGTILILLYFAFIVTSYVIR